MKKMKMIIVVCFIFSLSSSLFANSLGHWEDKHQTVAHAMGRIDGIDYTNCKEAFLESYEKGYRVFEVDMALSTDNHLVFLHDWNTFWGLTIQKGITGEVMPFHMYKAQKIRGSYTVLTADTLLELLSNYPDAYIITDTKSIDTESFKLQLFLLVEAASRLDFSLLDRLIIQVYNEETATALEEVYPFKNVIYTLYMSPDRNNIPSISSTLTLHNIRVLTVPSALISSELIQEMDAINVKIFTHTVNTSTDVATQRSKGIYGFYTDILTPCTIQYADHALLSQNITLKINGKFITTTVPPYIQNDTTLVPLRVITEHLGGVLDYIPVTKTILLSGPSTIALTVGSRSATVDNIPIYLSAEPYIMENTTMVPIRFIAEAFNLSVVWDADAGVISINENNLVLN